MKLSKNEFLSIIKSKDTKKEYQAYLELSKEVSENEYFYDYIGDCIKLLNSEKSYIRIRVFNIICFMSKYDNNNVIDNNIIEILNILNDEKPTNVRQALKSLVSLITNKPLLNNIILNEVNNIDLKKYKDNMMLLIKKDIIALKKLL